MRRSNPQLGGGGNVLDSLFPGYKDKIWKKLSPATREYLIKRENAAFESEMKAQCVTRASRFAWFSKNVTEPLKPSYEFRKPVVDYKRQTARGTTVVGRDWYLPQGARDRLDTSVAENVFEPFTAEEQAERKQHRTYSLAWKLGGLAAIFLLLDQRSRNSPHVWCMEKDPPHAPNYPFWFKGFTHSHDIPSVRRGYEVYRKVCATCHSMEQISFRHLINEVYPEKRVKQIAASYDVVDGPNEQGEMFTRPGIPNDSFPKPYPNDEAARYANGGALPPDLSVMTSARHDGPNYLMALLTSYRDPPEGVELRQGLYYNTYFPGGALSMPPPLSDGVIDYEDGTPATVSQMAKDLVNFIAWAGEPTTDERKVTGLKAVSLFAFGMVTMGWSYRFQMAQYKTRRIDFTKVVM